MFYKRTLWFTNTGREREWCKAIGMDVKGCWEGENKKSARRLWTSNLILEENSAELSCVAAIIKSCRRNLQEIQYEIKNVHQWDPPEKERGREATVSHKASQKAALHLPSELLKIIISAEERNVSRYTLNRGILWYVRLIYQGLSSLPYPTGKSSRTHLFFQPYTFTHSGSEHEW